MGVSPWRSAPPAPPRRVSPTSCQGQRGAARERRGPPRREGAGRGVGGGLARGGSSESQRSGSTDPAPGPKCLGLPRWGIRRRRGFIPRRVTREGGTWRREGRGRRREGGGGRPSAERAPRTMCGRRRPRDRPPARRQTPAPHGVPPLGRSGDGAEVPLGRPAPRPNRAARCEGGAAPAPCRPHTSPGQRAGRGAPLLTPQGIARERAGGAGSAGGAAGPCGGEAWRRAGSCRSRLEFSTRLPPSPWKRCQAGLLPAAASCRAGAPRGPAVGVGRAGGCFSRALRRRQGAGRGRAARGAEAGGGGAASASRFPI